MALLKTILQTIGELIIYFLLFLKSLFKREINKREVLNHMETALINSIPTVIITNMTIGMVSSLQLTRYFVDFGMGAEIGGSNATALIRELAPVITAIVLTGRIGSAWAAEIGSMKMTEQISALKIMKISLDWFLISPRILATVLAMPILNFIAILAGLAGGYFVSSQIAPMELDIFIDSIKRYISFFDCIATSTKAIIFGFIISGISCIYGLRAQGGAYGVGQYTTKAVVNSMIYIFASNFILTYIFYSLLK